MSLGQLRQLQSLDLHSNQLTALPMSLGQLTQLQSLDLAGNRLTALPESLGQLAQLQSLTLWGNQLTALPEALGLLNQLQSLDLAGNPLAPLPAVLGQLTQLQWLDVSYSLLTALPEWLDQLTQLQSLNLMTNRLTALPEALGQLAQLQSLNVSYNRLTSLPETLGQLTQLQWLDVAYNQLTALPEVITKLGRLAGVDCQYNPQLRFPPLDIAELGAKATSRYLRAVGEEAETVWESKMLLVGEGQTGKTWLYEALNGRFKGGERKEDTGTIGIEIGTLELPHPVRPGVTMRLNTWDFAGQEINHATHQFFFSNRTLFLLVWSARAGLAAGKVEKWLKNIRDRAPQARVILVAAQWDSPHNEYAREELKKAFPQLVETVEISSLTGEGIHRLRALVARHAAELPMMGLRWPTAWRRAAQELTSLRASTPHTTLAAVWEKLQAQGLESDESTLLIRWLHELGEVQHFPEPLELAGRVVLNPQWLTKHVGQVLASRLVEEKKGLVTRECLAEVWGEHDEPLRDFLLALMEAFDLAYRIPDDPAERSLVVERLPEDPVDYSDKWGTKAGEPELRLRLRLESLHPGIPTWFIARCHRFTQGRHWRRGVLFGDERKAPRHLGLIVANEFERTVDFTVRGPFPFTFMPLLRDGFFATVERRYPGLKIEKKVPCPGKHRDGRDCTHEFTLEELEGLIAPAHAEDEPILEIQCFQCRRKHRVQDLLCGLGFAPLSGDITLSRLAEMVGEEGVKTRHHLDERVVEMRRWWQLEFVRQWNVEQGLEEQSCPSVLAFYPLEGGSLFHSPKLRVQLYCMHPGCWHSVGAGGRCEFAPVRENIVKAGRFLAKWAGWLKPAAMLLGAAVPVAGGAVGLGAAAAKSLKEELDLTAKALEQLEKLPTEGVANPKVTIGDSRVPVAREREALGGLKEFLDSLAFPVKPYGGLKRVRTPEEHVLWLCPQHAGEFARR